MPSDLHVRNLTRTTVLATRGWEARTSWSRIVGLLRHKNLEEGQGLYIPHCNSIHSFWMQFEFDAVFVSKSHHVLHLIPRMKRGRISKIVWNADGVWELPSGTIAATQTQIGDQLDWSLQ